LSYSNLAETIFDYALSEAKRTESETVNRVHLVAALRKWNISKFDEKFPDSADRITTAIASIESQGARPTEPDSETHAILLEISGVDDAWEAAEKLLQSDVLSDNAPAVVRQNAPSSSGVVKKQVSEEDPKKWSIDITSELQNEIALLLEMPEEDVRKKLASDIYVIAHRVLESSPDVDMSALTAASDIEPMEVAAETGRSDVLEKLLQVGSAQADSAAKQYALGLVSVASFAASMDDHVTEEEIDVIDSLRIELRHELEKLSHHSESDYLTTFDERFAGVVGLESVKKELRQRIDYFRVGQIRKARGLSTAGHSMHMAFLGNPGTGKTTVARLFATVLKEMNFLDSDTLVEVDRSGLVGEYVGHTEKKTNDVVDSALGGVLFIDEAYSLVDDNLGGKSFGDLAIDVLVKRMEDDRDKLMVVVAGYEEPMQNFIESNEGLKSRIPLKLYFEDYTPDQLVEVVERFAAKDGFKMDSMCIKKFHDAAISISQSEIKGNGRDMRNVYEKTVRNQSSRVAEIGELATSKELTTLMAEDVAEVELPKNNKKQIGFR
jgi:AAA+ superfamily predicted ATPase